MIKNDDDYLIRRTYTNYGGVNMQVTICDMCKTILEEKELHFVGDFHRGFDLCDECRKKYIKIKEEYYKQDDELEKQREILFDKYKEKLKNIGLNY